jgi:hypothetical protein
MTSENSNSLSKQEAIQELRKNIEQIETIIQQLNNTSVTELPSSNTIASLTKTTTELEEIIAQKIAIKNDSDLIQSDELLSDNIDTNKAKKTTTIKPESTATENISQASPAKKTDVKSQEISTDSIVNNQQKSKKNRRNILIAVAIFVITIIPLSWEFFIAQKNPTVVAPDIAQTLVKNKADSLEIDQNIIEQAEPTVEDFTTKIAPPTTEQITETNPEIPSELLAERKPKKIAVKAIKVSKKLTSEQNLIAAIEDKERELIEDYTNDLVTLIEPNFEDNIVTITVADNWYNMEFSKQDRITDEILKKSRQLEFNKLKIIDSQNNLVARSPVVGKNIVILRRTT